LKGKTVLQQVVNTYPPTVRAALACLCLSTAILALLTIAAWANLLSLPNSASVTLNNLLTVAFMLLVIAKLAAGRGWARWVFAVVYFLGSAVTVYLSVFEPQIFRNQPVTLQITGLAQLALQTLAMVLLVLPASQQWFAPQRMRVK
jgi:glucan phosphoethanolaminetransferase (alkaline phosphatase superfamily)